MLVTGAGQISMAIARRVGKLLRAIEAGTMKGEYPMASAKTLRQHRTIAVSALA